MRLVGTKRVLGPGIDMRNCMLGRISHPEHHEGRRNIMVGIKSFLLQGLTGRFQGLRRRKKQSLHPLPVVVSGKFGWRMMILYWITGRVTPTGDGCEACCLVASLE